MEFNNKKFVYVEPFVGGGAVLFWMLRNYKNIEKAIINDINTDLMNCYLTIRDDVKELIVILKEWEKEYHLLEKNHEMKAEYYYQKRQRFNERNSDHLIQSALLIFLNRTCFNGLYRVNKRNEFNVPIGRYKTPLICDASNLRSVSQLLHNVVILNGDFEITLNYANEDTLYYLDPPYKPLSKTSNFTFYSDNGFDDKEQIRLAEFCKKIDLLGSHLILSNSDVYNNSQNHFFDELYKDFYIERVLVRRIINSNKKKRGFLTELLITNELIN